MNSNQYELTSRSRARRAEGAGNRVFTRVHPRPFMVKCFDF